MEYLYFAEAEVSRSEHDANITAAQEPDPTPEDRPIHYWKKKNGWVREVYIYIYIVRERK